MPNADQQLSKAEILARLEAFLDGWEFGDEQMQAEADELLKLVQDWQTEGLAAEEEVG